MEILKFLAASNPVIDGANNAVDESQPNDDLISPVQALINAFIGIIGIIAVVMIIVGAVQLQTSQGDSGKVKKGKDSIMYGIIGLVIAVLAFSIVNFVLASVF